MATKSRMQRELERRRVEIIDELYARPTKLMYDQLLEDKAKLPKWDILEKRALDEKYRSDAQALAEKCQQALAELAAMPEFEGCK